MSKSSAEEDGWIAPGKKRMNRECHTKNAWEWVYDLYLLGIRISIRYFLRNIHYGGKTLKIHNLRMNDKENSLSMVKMVR